MMGLMIDENALLAHLNTAQKEAVTAELGYTLVLAGAGSGKTRVLVHRIAWLIQHYRIAPHSIMAVTFTNKAANHMRQQLEDLMNYPCNGMWMGTFHGLCHRLLRRYHEQAQLAENFQILDQEDQARLLKQIHKTLGLDEQEWPVKKSQYFINQHKEKGMRANDIKVQGNPRTYQLKQIMQDYEAHCQRAMLVDFTELLLRCYELLRDNDALRSELQQQFQYLLIDEFQDSNEIQYQWIQQLAGPNTPIMIVGDDDQSIYSWRGACVENMFQFERDYKPCKVFRLEQNYRSTKTILDAANAVIKQNQGRMGKALWTEHNNDNLIELYKAYNDTDEARFVIRQIQKAVDQGLNYDDCAILYRSNAQSRVLEEQLLQAQLPYKIYGGLRFYERAEIKDALAYMRLIANNNDDYALSRIINTPTRGIGATTLKSLQIFAREQQCSLWQACQTALTQTEQLNARAHKALSAFISLIHELGLEAENQPLNAFCETLLNQTGLFAMYSKEKTEQNQNKLDNLHELIHATQLQAANNPDKRSTLIDFLAKVSLDQHNEQADSNRAIQLMTLHASKGLEFPNVFLVGLEDGLFPSQMALLEPQQVEEERRLCYVGITRAKSQLTLSYTETRYLHGRHLYQRISRFIKEIPKECLHAWPGAEVDLAKKAIHPRPQTSNYNNHYRKPAGATTPKKITTTNNHSPYHLGQNVRHEHFGEGVILAIENQGKKLQIRFARAGIKWLLTEFAPLQIIS
jgi:DNA helicase II / ATP-dependent DNA helicase PcrA